MITKAITTKCNDHHGMDTKVKIKDITIVICNDRYYYQDRIIPNYFHNRQVIHYDFQNVKPA